MDLLFAIGAPVQISKENLNTLSPSVQLQTENFQKYFDVFLQHDITYLKNTSQCWTEMTDAQLRKAVEKLCIDTDKTWFELKKKDLPQELYKLFRARSKKKAAAADNGDVVSYMLWSLGFGKRVWRNTEEERQRAITVMKEKIIPFLLSHRFNDSEKEFVKICPYISPIEQEKELVKTGDLYFTRFRDVGFSHAMLNVLHVATLGIANTIGGSALEFGRIVEEATDGRIKAEQVVRAHYRRQIDSKLEEIYKYAPFLLKIFKRKAQVEKLQRILFYYDNGGEISEIHEEKLTAEEEKQIIQEEQDKMREINTMHKFLLKKLPHPEFLTCVKDILSFAGWLKEAEYLSKRDKEFADKLEMFWPQGQVEYSEIQDNLQGIGTQAIVFHDKKIKIIIEILNTRLSRWQVRKSKEERDYLKLIKRSAGWFSLLGIHDLFPLLFKVKQSIKVLDQDAFFSSGYVVGSEKAESDSLKCVPDVTDLLYPPCGILAGRNPNQYPLSFADESWPIPESSFDAVTSCFNLHKLSAQEIVDVFHQANKVLKENGYFVITVPFNKYLPEEGIRVLENVGFKLHLEQIATQVMKHQNNVLSDEESEKKDAQAISIQKRKFYVLVFQKQENADGQKFQSSDLKNQESPCFINAPLIEEDKVSLAEIGNSRKFQILGVPRLDIETVPFNALSLSFLGGRIRKTPILKPDQLRFMLKTLRKYQNVLLNNFLNEGQELDEGPKDDFSRLNRLMMKYQELLDAEDDILKRLELNIHHDILLLFQKLEEIYPQFTESSNIRSLLDELGVFLELNEDFLTAQDRALIKQARRIWGQEIISEEYAEAAKLRQMNSKIIDLHKKIKQLEKEFIDVLRKLSEGKTEVRDAQNKAFWPLIQDTSGWRALSGVADKYQTNSSGKKIYFPQSTALEKMIIEKALSGKTNKLVTVEYFTASENVKARANTADFVCSVFDPVQEEKHFFIEPYLNNARMFLRQKGKLVVVLPKGKYLVSRCRELLLRYGFIINEEYSAMEYNLIEAAKGEDHDQRFLNLLKKHPAITSEQLLEMVRILHKYQNVLVDQFVNEGKDNEFTALLNILDVYESLTEQEDLIVDTVDFDINTDIPFLYEILEKIYPSFKERPRFKALLFKLRAFAEQNSDFLSVEDKALIPQGENIWQSGVLLEKYADAKSMSMINNQMFDLEKKIEQIEIELVLVLNKWSDSPVELNRLRNREFLPFIGDTSVGQVLETILPEPKETMPELSIYFSGSIPFEKTIFEKILSKHAGARIVAESFSVETLEKHLDYQADIICSVFDNSLIPNDKELLVARRLLKQKGKWIIMLPKTKETVDQFMELLIRNGFKINRKYSKGAFCVIEVDKGGWLEQTRVQLKKINQSGQITARDEAYLSSLWQWIFKKHGFEDQENLLLRLREFISILPVEEHFKIMLEQLEQAYKKMTKKRFISLDGLEKFLRDSNAACGWNFKLDDQRDETGKLTIEGLLIHEQNGERPSLFLSLEEDVFWERFDDLGGEIEVEKKFLKALNLSGIEKRLQANLETLNKVFSADTKGLKKLYDFLMIKKHDERFLQILYATLDHLDEQSKAFSALERFSGNMDTEKRKVTKQLLLIVTIIKDCKRFLEGLSDLKFCLRNDSRFIQALDLIKEEKIQEDIMPNTPEELIQMIDYTYKTMDEFTLVLESVTVGKKIIDDTEALIPHVEAEKETLKNFMPAADKVNQIVLEGLAAGPEFEERCRHIIATLPESMMAELACLPHVTEIGQLFRQIQGRGVDVLDTRNVLEEKLLMLMRAPKTSSAFAVDHDFRGEASYYWGQLEEYVNEDASYLRLSMLAVMLDARKYEGICGLERVDQIKAKMKEIEDRFYNTAPKSNLVLVLRSLFVLNQWMEMETRNVNYKIFIQQEINSIFNYLMTSFEKDLIAWEMFKGDLLSAKYHGETFFWRGLIKNEKDEEFFSKKVAETFYFNEHLFSLNFKRWLYSIAYSDQADQTEYLKLLGKILGHFECKFAGRKKEMAWLGKKLQIAQRQINVVFSEAQCELVEEWKQKPIEEKDIKRIASNELREILQEIWSKRENIVAGKAAFPPQVLENFIARIELLVFFMAKYKQADSEKEDLSSVKRREAALISKLFDGSGTPKLQIEEDLSEKKQWETLIIKLLNISGAPQEISMIAASEIGEVPIVKRQLAQLVVPDQKFARFLESISKNRALIVELMDNNEQARRAILNMLDSDDYYEVYAALLVIRKYFMHKGADGKGLLTAIWRIVFSKHGLKLDAMLRVKITELLPISLPEDNKYNLKVFRSTVEQFQGDATENEITTFARYLEKILEPEDTEPKKTMIKKKKAFESLDHFERSV